MTRLASLALFLTVPSACADRPDVPAETPTFTVRDSAGIEIVESHAPVWTEGEAWSISPEPILQIGAVDGEPAYLFARPEQIQQFEDGRVLVVEGETSEIRVFDATGVHTVSFGRSGDAPGEFQTVPLVQFIHPDTVRAWDPRAQRFTWWSPSTGALLTDEPLGFDPTEGPSGLGRTSASWRVARDGTLVARQSLTFSDGQVVGSRLQAGERWETRYTYAILDPSSGVTSTVPDTIPYRLVMGSMFFSAGAGAMELFGEPLEIVLTSSSGWELSTFGQDGRPRRITRLPIARRSTEGDIEALRTTQLPVAIDVAEVLAEVTEDRILTIWQDEFDVPFLRAYHLARGGG